MAFTVNNKDFESKEEFVLLGRGCATKIPTPVDIIRVDEDLAKNRTRAPLFEKLTIEVKYIHITNGEKGRITTLQRESQITLLNQAFGNAGLNFIYNEDDTIFIDNEEWYTMGHRSLAEREAKTQLGFDATQYLNFYTAGLGNGLLGWATFPMDLEGDVVMDGVVLLDESLPGGNAAPYNLGMTGVHEVGHWLGLYHTFQGGCNGIGDQVSDTTAHSGPNYGTPEEGKPHNACNKDEFAPIHNYMNYVDDEWMDELTEKQEVRIKEEILMYRTGLITAEANTITQ